MKYFTLLPLAALSAALVIPDDEVISEVAIHSHHSSDSVIDQLPFEDDLSELTNEGKHTFHKIVDTGKNAFDQAIDYVQETSEKAKKSCHQTAFDAKSWLESASENTEQKIKEIKEHGKNGHHHEPNMTVYELIAKSKYTTKLAALINEYEDLVQILNGTAANYTLFAPIDSAFEKIPEHAPKPSKEELKKVLLYHASKEFYPAGRVLVTHTVPTLLVGEYIGGEPQRLSTNIGLKGLTVNFYSRIVAIDIVCSSLVFKHLNMLIVFSSEQTASFTASTASLFHLPRLLISFNYFPVNSVPLSLVLQRRTS